MHKVHKKQAYTIGKSLFFLRPFYVFSTSFLRNGYMEIWKVHKVYIFGGGYVLAKSEYPVSRIFVLRVSKIFCTFAG